jgi:hypothetical protein
MAAEPRDLLIVAATVAVLGGGLFAATQGPRPPVVKQPAVEEPKPPAKPKAEHAPLPKLKAPAPIVRPEARGKGKQADRPKPKKLPNDKNKSAKQAGPRGMTREMCKRRSRSLPSCDVVRWCQSQMSWGDQMTAYLGATAEQVAHGRKCLGR